MEREARFNIEVVSARFWTILNQFVPQFDDPGLRKFEDPTAIPAWRPTADYDDLAFWGTVHLRRRGWLKVLAVGIPVLFLCINIELWAEQYPMFIGDYRVPWHGLINLPILFLLSLFAIKIQRTDVTLASPDGEKWTVKMEDIRTTWTSERMSNLASDSTTELVFLHDEKRRLLGTAEFVAVHPLLRLWQKAIGITEVELRLAPALTEQCKRAVAAQLFRHESFLRWR